MVRKNKNDLANKLLIGLLGLYVFVTSLVMITKQNLLIFWPLILFVGTAGFSVYIFYRIRRDDMSRSLSIGIIIEALLTTCVLCSKLLGNLADSLGLHCDGLFGTVTQCSDSLMFSPEGIGVIMIIPMLVVAALSFHLRSR